MSYESYAILRPFFSVFSDIFVNYDPNRHAIANSYNRKLKQVISMGPKKRKTSIFTFCGSDGFFTRSDVFSKYDYVIQHGGGHNGNHVLCFCIPILHMHTSNIFKYQPKRTKTEQMRVVSVQIQNPSEIGVRPTLITMALRSDSADHVSPVAQERRIGSKNGKCIWRRRSEQAQASTN